MFNFLANIFEVIGSAVAVILVSIGLVVSPVPANLVDVSADEIVEEVTKKKEVVEPSPKISPKSSPQTFTTPNGAIIDALGNLIKAPTPIDITPSSVAVEILDFKVNATPREGQKDISDTRVDWKTNVPTESKIFLTDVNGKMSIYESRTGLSTNHFISIGSFEGDSYSYEIEAIGKEDFTKQSGVFTVQKRPVPIPKKLNVLVSGTQSFEHLSDTNSTIGVAGSKCESIWFAVAVIDQYGNTMANQNITLQTPEGSITKTVPDQDYQLPNNDKIKGVRINYNPVSNGVKQLLTFSAAELTESVDLYVSDVDWNYKIAKRTQELNDGSIEEWWVVPASGQEFNIETMTCITNQPVLY